jgi:hypothetical protein
MPPSQAKSSTTSNEIDRVEKEKKLNDQQLDANIVKPFFL